MKSEFMTFKPGSIAISDESHVQYVTSIAEDQTRLSDINNQQPEPVLILANQAALVIDKKDQIRPLNNTVHCSKTSNKPMGTYTTTVVLFAQKLGSCGECNDA